MSSLLLVHDDSVLRDYLAQVFETREFEVVAHSTARAALSAVRARAFDVVVADWTLAGGVGRTLYDQSVKARPAMRDRFVFVGAGEGCLDPWDVEELIRVVEATARRARGRAALSPAQRVWLSGRRPRLLLVEDEPLELMAMARVLDELGFEVTPADCGNAAIERLRDGDFDVILSDWYMDDGSGADLYAYVTAHHPEMARRIVFMSGAAPRDFDRVAPGRTLVPKGQDSPYLVEALMRAARGE